MFRVLIVGDSFGADWTKKYKEHGLGWTNIIADKFNITNLAQAGCGEYKILLQIKSIDLSEFDIIVVNHTSPYRFYVTEHPVHKNDILHYNSDLLYLDLLHYYKTEPTDNIKIAIAIFERYFDLDYANYIYGLIYNDIIKQCENIKTLHLIHTDSSINDKKLIRISKFNKKNKGLMNHYNEKTNIAVANIVTEHILKKLKDV